MYIYILVRTSNGDCNIMHSYTSQIGADNAHKLLETKNKALKIDNLRYKVVKSRVISD